MKELIDRIWNASGQDFAIAMVTMLIVTIAALGFVWWLSNLWFRREQARWQKRREEFLKRHGQ